MSDQMKTGPLAGIKVVDMSTVVFGPLATMILGDLGADVVKVESPNNQDVMRFAGDSPTGDLGPIFTALNRNKTSRLLDIKKPEDRAELDTLLSEADVFLHNIRMASAGRLGLDYESVRALRSDIIYVHCAGFGSDGPYAGQP
ncbi:MAG: CoA transferase, partial [Pseudomonadota bacterium]